MIILGSTFREVMNSLRGKLDPEDTLRDFDETLPLAAQLSDVNVLILGMFKVSRKELDAAPRLRLIHQHGRGVDGVDLPYATQRGILVANVPGGNSVSVAEHAMALLLFMAKRMYAAEVPRSERRIGEPAGLELAGKTLGIIGLGASGSELARRARAFGMSVLATKMHPSVTPPGIDLGFLGGPEDLPRTLRESDFISLHVPLTGETRGLIGDTELKQMKPSAYLINVARGPLVNHEALYTALRNRSIAGAAFDVFWKEPADPEDPIFRLDNFIMTPHVAGFSDVTIGYISQVISENIRRLRRGEQLVHVVNPLAAGSHT